MQEHRELVDEDLCAFVRAKIFANAAMAIPEIMAREAQHWIENEGGVMPPGNGAESAKWSGQGDFSSSEEASTSERTAAMVSPFSQATVCPQPLEGFVLRVSSPVVNVPSSCRQGLGCVFKESAGGVALHQPTRHGCSELQ
jgi:hypothetical protein